MPSAPAATAGRPAACLNCGAPLGEPRPRFCSACGQETQIRPPRLGEFLQQFGGAYFATEGALWRTLKLLLLRPGELTAQYLAGRRKHYVLPLRLYLSISVVALLLLRGLGGGVEVQMKEDTPGEIARATNNLNIQLGNGRAGLREGVYYCENLPAWVCKRFKRRIDIDPRAMLGEVDALRERFLGNLGGAMFLLLPSFALWLKLAYWQRHLRFTEHLVFALHVHALWFLALALALAGLDWLRSLLVLAVPVYTLLAMKRVYGGRWWPRLLRAAAVALAYGVVLAVALAFVGLWTLLV